MGSPCSPCSMGPLDRGSPEPKEVPGLAWPGLGRIMSIMPRPTPPRIPGVWVMPLCVSRTWSGLAWLGPYWGGGKQERERGGLESIRSSDLTWDGVAHGTGLE
jgi:hypothetical protein